jgi:hypothetical protein
MGPTDRCLAGLAGVGCLKVQIRKRDIRYRRMLIVDVGFLPDTVEKPAEGRAVSGVCISIFGE